jgi:hypothetical protein
MPLIKTTRCCEEKKWFVSLVGEFEEEFSQSSSPPPDSQPDFFSPLGFSPPLIKTCIPMKNSLKVLGTLISRLVEEITKFFQRNASTALQLLVAASSLKLQHFLLLTRLCVSSRVAHLLRTLAIPGYSFSHFDEFVRCVIDIGR